MGNVYTETSLNLEVLKMRRKTVYPAHPISGDVASNVARVKQIMRKMNIEDNVQAVAPYVPDCDGVLDDTVLAEREMGISNDIEHFLRGMIDEVWLYGDRISFGMWQEIKLARSLKIPVVAMTPETEQELWVADFVRDYGAVHSSVVLVHKVYQRGALVNLKWHQVEVLIESMLKRKVLESIVPGDVILGEVAR